MNQPKTHTVTPNAVPQGNLGVGVFLSDISQGEDSRFSPWRLLAHLNGAQWNKTQRSIFEEDCGVAEYAARAVSILGTGVDHWQSFGFYAKLYKEFSGLRQYAQTVRPDVLPSLEDFLEYAKAQRARYFPNEPARDPLQFAGPNPSILWILRYPQKDHTPTNKADAELCLLANTVANGSYIQGARRLGFTVL